MAEMDSDVMEAETTQTVGERLQAARLAAGLELSDIAGRTRVPLRHLEAIERGDYGALPATTYATGFTRAYARALELDDVALIRDLREELQHIAEAPEYQPYEAADPARVPPRWLAWGGVAAALVVLALFGWWYSSRLASPSAAPEVVAVPAPVAATPDSATGGAPAAAAAPAPSTGPVILTATQPVWLRIYDATDTRLFEKEMAQGERYEVPANANQPMILTGRPDALQVTVGGQQVAPLGDGKRSISGVVLTAQALAARQAPPAADTAPPGAPSAAP
jgi:cytoskeletal protein RodZ